MFAGPQNHAGPLPAITTHGPHKLYFYPFRKLKRLMPLLSLLRGPLPSLLQPSGRSVLKHVVRRLECVIGRWVVGRNEFGSNLKISCVQNINNMST